MAGSGSSIAIFALAFGFQQVDKYLIFRKFISVHFCPERTLFITFITWTISNHHCEKVFGRFAHFWESSKRNWNRSKVWMMNVNIWRSRYPGISRMFISLLLYENEQDMNAFFPLVYILQRRFVVSEMVKQHGSFKLESNVTTNVGDVVMESGLSNVEGTASM